MKRLGSGTSRRSSRRARSLSPRRSRRRSRARRKRPLRRSGPAGPLTLRAAEAQSITSVNAQTFLCTQPDPRQDACYINVAYTSGTGPHRRLIRRLSPFDRREDRLPGAGLLQQTASTDYTFPGLGFRVACGPPVNDPGDPGVPEEAGRQRLHGRSELERGVRRLGSRGPADSPVPAPLRHRHRGRPSSRWHRRRLREHADCSSNSASTLTISDLAQFPLWLETSAVPSAGCASSTVPGSPSPCPAGRRSPTCPSP